MRRNQRPTPKPNRVQDEDLASLETEPKHAALTGVSVPQRQSASNYKKDGSR